MLAAMHRQRARLTETLTALIALERLLLIVGVSETKDILRLDLAKSLTEPGHSYDTNQSIRFRYISVMALSILE